MRETFKLVDSGEFSCSLFQTCVPSFYERLGARVITNRIVNSLGADPEARPFWDPTIMVYPKTYDWPEGTIDLLGRGTETRGRTHMSRCDPLLVAAKAHGAQDAIVINAKDGIVVEKRVNLLCRFGCDEYGRT